MAQAGLTAQQVINSLDYSEIEDARLDKMVPQAEAFERALHALYMSGGNLLGLLGAPKPLVRP